MTSLWFKSNNFAVNMNHMYRSLLLFVILATNLMSCGNSDSAIIQKRVNEVMAIHDEVMPKMDVMVAHEDKLKALKLKVTDKAELDHLDRQIGQLEEAGELMMSWMRKFSMPSEEDKKPLEEVMKYLDKEEKQITVVRDAMNASLEEAMETVERYKKK